jgi:hypothetical protein
MGITYRFAPGVTFDLGGGYLFAGSALDQVADIGLHAGGTACGAAPGCTARYGAENSFNWAARIRYAF